MLYLHCEVDVHCLEPGVVVKCLIFFYIELIVIGRIYLAVLCGILLTTYKPECTVDLFF